MKKRHLLKIFLLTVAAVLILLPVIITFLYSFFAPDEIRSFMETRSQYGEQMMEIKLSPHKVSLEQYWHILIEDTSVLRYYFNSIVYTLTILVCQAIIVPAMAYALSRYKYPGRDLLSFLIIVLLLLPFQITMVPTVLMLRNLELMDTLWAIILPSIASPFYVFLIRQNMLGIPNELFEAAQIDGAGPIRCFFHIALPVSRAILGAALALSFADCWNMVEQPLVFLPTQTSLYPLSVAFNQLSRTSTGVEFAGASLFLIPALLIYLFFQKDIMTAVRTEMKGMVS